VLHRSRDYSDIAPRAAFSGALDLVTTFRQRSRTTGLAVFAIVTAVLPTFSPNGMRANTYAASAAPLSTNCDVDPSALGADDEEQSALDQTNAYRAAYGLQPLQVSYTLTVTAEWKANDMAARHYADHNDGFRTWDQRFHDCGYNYPGAWFGENLARGNSTGYATLMQWENSPLHNENLLDANYSAIGIKRVHSTDPGDSYGWYWTMELGSTVD
jgi:uncharacterized protein YkwD